jgi:hypothetical protein
MSQIPKQLTANCVLAAGNDKETPRALTAAVLFCHGQESLPSRTTPPHRDVMACIWHGTKAERRTIFVIYFICC